MFSARSIVNLLGGFFHCFNNAGRDTRRRKTSVVKQVLHSYHLRKIAEQRYAVVSTLFGAGISQRAHLVGIGNETIEAFYATSRRGARGRLRNSIDTYFVFDSIMISETAGDAFQQ